ncbi:MAG: BlaI/MecI/CopY family transcriptional regulator [Oscillospiraceae bacterium]|nr:BlaI/MecI/CopY family transcriptional regulator [Oscillospiraceae bacterium]
MKRLPDAEFAVMQGVWHSDVPVSTADIKSCLDRKKEWNMSALQTVLSRLEEKGFVKSEKAGRNRFYTPLVTEEEYLVTEGESFAERIGTKSVPGLVAAMFGGRKISRAEAEELMEFINKNRKE